MKIHVPTIGDRIELCKRWKFELYLEDRNITLFQHLYPKDGWGKEGDPRSANQTGDSVWKPVHKKIPCSLPKGTTIVFDRLYMAKGAPEFHSVTFIVKKNDPVLKNKRQVRFWVKLAEVNKIDGTINPDGAFYTLIRIRYKLTNDPKLMAKLRAMRLANPKCSPPEPECPPCGKQEDYYMIGVVLISDGDEPIILQTGPCVRHTVAYSQAKKLLKDYMDKRS